MRTYEIRDPIHGFVVLNDWEREIVHHPAFQRLRRIRQLGWTDMVYPGATHSRFEHSLGVMHVATRMFDEIVGRREDFLRAELHYTPDGIRRDRVLVRLAALLHDVGHAPFSHAAEGLMKRCPGTKRNYKHEDYSAAVVQLLMKDVIENHPLDQNYGIKAEQVADFLKGSSTLGRCLIWWNLISSQLDADRADYLLRDSHHSGVEYGRYDLNRLLVTMSVALDPLGSPTLAIEEGGAHAAEGLILARYMMFTQMYFHRTRRAYDRHFSEALKSLLGEQKLKAFPAPNTVENVKAYLQWTDWRVLGMLDEGRGGEHGAVLRTRTHYRSIYETPETPLDEDFDFLVAVRESLGKRIGFIDTAASSWYKFDLAEIAVLLSRHSGEKITYLSKISSVVSGLRAVNQTRIYVSPERRAEAWKIVDGLSEKKDRPQ